MPKCYPWRFNLRLWKFRKVSQQTDEHEEKANSDSSKCSALPDDICRRFSLSEIKAATHNFNPNLIIGAGFGYVYRATIDDGNNGTKAVAVKRYEDGFLSENVTKFFRNEVIRLCQLRHPNLVTLVGFCDEQNEMIVVYEFMSGGTLSGHLYGYVHLSWKQRLEICIGAARGLHYLHTGAKYPLFHGHIKSLNILLDENLTPKLSGFAFSKMGNRGNSKASLVRQDSRVLGTYGYMAPEYESSLEVTEKSEVYSFGIILFEVLFGRRAFDATLPENEQLILDWASEYIRKGTVYQIIDPYLKGRIAPESFKKYLEIACSCVCYDRNERPAMGEVEVTLELALELQQEANRPELDGIYHPGEFMYGELSFSIPNAYFDLLRRHFDGHRQNILLGW
ncbi:hypothetical protein COLO4_31160 [Corchorus olitorius]|uniref:Protein kinase domain-containing protein n=1 Tax=Corchorus olitorius TaxID=93759 RepID=A0A1R3H5E9_9ROSI|nr:hypothetical protein COLO4_31160 [Corchorus olitorius]